VALVLRVGLVGGLEIARGFDVESLGTIA